MDILQLSREVAALEAQIGEVDYYTMLELPRDATDVQIKSAFHKRAKMLHVDTWGEQTLSPNLKAQMYRVLSELTRAQTLLLNKDERAEYDAMLALTERGVPTDVRKIFAADEAFKNGKRLLERGSFREAYRMLREATEVNPSEPDFWAYRRWAEYCMLDTNADGRPARSGEVERIRIELEKLVNGTEHCDMGHVFLGHIAKAHDDLDEATRQYKTALRKNGRNTEAQTNLRLLSMREAKRNTGLFQRIFGRK